MEVQKPKPWRGWREFGKEVATIVLGVLIAIGAEQAVEQPQALVEQDQGHHRQGG